MTFTTMSDDELRLVLVTALKYLLTSTSTGILTPLTSLDLLSNVLTVPIPPGLLPHSPPQFRLTDLDRFERLLEELSKTWDEGWIVLSRSSRPLKSTLTGNLTIYGIGLGTGRHGPNRTSLSYSASTSSTETSSTLRKRKRVVDEDADSAAGDGEDEDEPLASGQDDLNSLERPSGGSTLASLSPEMREVYTFMQKETAKGRLLAERFRSREDIFESICIYITKEECAKARRSLSNGNPHSPTCDHVHFRPLIRPHTDIALGHCSYLNTCYSEPTYAQSPSIPPLPSTQHAHGHPYAGMALPNSRGAMSLPSGLGAGGRGKEKAPCRYLHYEIDWDPPAAGWEAEWKKERDRKGKESRERKAKEHRLQIGMGPTGKEVNSLPPQWINCDLRTFDYSVLGKFHVIMADPPWDIHMSLPYGTMKDDEMRAMPIPLLQDEGFLFLWVTGRAMEVGRECLEVWGYQRIDEVVWVKTNQLQRVIRTGRTGHWLNHTKEHMLVGVKRVLDSAGRLKFPSWANRGVDTDVIVSEVRETSRKPDEVYGIIERLCPGGRKVEIFGRKHNTRPGWLTLGNQLGSDQVYEEDLALRIKAKYPERQIRVPTPYRTQNLALP